MTAKAIDFAGKNMEPSLNGNVTAADAAVGETPACILALNPNASSARHVQGTACVRAVGCNIHVNSDHAASTSGQTRNDADVAPASAIAE